MRHSACKARSTRRGRKVEHRRPESSNQSEENKLSLGPFNYSINLYDRILILEALPGPDLRRVARLELKRRPECVSGVESADSLSSGGVIRRSRGRNASRNPARARHHAFIFPIRARVSFRRSRFTRAAR